MSPKCVSSGNISHELKTPIALISGQLELILMSNYSLSTIQNSLREVHNRAAKMGTLINELLDFLKYNKENFTLTVKQQDIILFTQEIYDSFVSYAELKNIISILCSTKKASARGLMKYNYKRFSITFYRMLSNSLRKMEQSRSK